MILGLGIALVVLLFTFWIFTMYASYKIEQGVEQKEISVSDIGAMTERILRLFRRGFYAGSMYIRNGFSWSNKQIESGFIKIVPSSAPAFEEKDELTGLKVGPMSFFLQSISESKTKSTRKRTGRKEKLV